MNGIRLRGGTLYDPINGVNGKRRDIFLQQGRIAALPRQATAASASYDLRGMVVMPGAIDIHTHIAGGKNNLARLLLHEDHRQHPSAPGRHIRAGSGSVHPSAALIGARYLQMGYTACFEPAMLAANARLAHAEMADIPAIDKGCYVLLGNDDFLLRMLQKRQEQSRINDYVAWMLNATHALAVKTVNPGGINAFKFNQRRMDLDEPNRHYGVSPRQVLLSLGRAVQELGLPHPLHVHGCNLGVAGNLQTTLDTIRGAEGLPLHLTHLQFHSYGKEGERGFSSGAAELAEAVNARPEISVDVGQIMFNQTVTASGDTMHQYRGRKHARPRRWICMDIECDAGCGVLPFRYREQSFVHALQWAIGLELFLLIQDPWRVFLSTDHPNGAPFSSYPHLIRLLMDRSFRNEALRRIHPGAAQMSTLSSIQREYSLYEIAILTRAGPARSLGLTDRGQLGLGAAADVTVYALHPDKERMFGQPEYVFKNGRLVVHRGQVLEDPGTGALHRVRPGYDRGIERTLAAYFNRYHTMRLENFAIGTDELAELYRGRDNAR